MKKFFSIIVAVINIVVNFIGYLTICVFLAKSELPRLNDFSKMVNPELEWYITNPGVALFAYKVHFIGILELIISLITIVLTVVYLRLNKSKFLDSYEYDSKNVIMAVLSISLCLSALLTSICSIPLYQQIPMSIVFIILNLLILKYIPIGKVLCRMGLGKQENK